MGLDSLDEGKDEGIFGAEAMRTGSGERLIDLENERPLLTLAGEVEGGSKLSVVGVALDVKLSDGVARPACTWPNGLETVDGLL